MATDTTYNGWANYETWNVNLWFDNEEPLYREKMRFIRRSNLTATRCENFAKEFLPNGTPDFDSPADFDKVNWDEIAEAWARDGE